ncbi:oxidoreductase [Diaminobutyricimonas sp. TR449]|uniref:oxidoreductase n=1 Tax=Diaminobutyricimonas sp. TR449 TaxID=2708076 RepID=UPI00141F1F32|nr:oxidoreductase [Diaminobutyricimonas sp. TR449]
MRTPKVALVTGASSGIGEATARRLAGLGLTVYGSARRLDRMSTLEADGIRLLHMDVTDDASMTAGVERILADTGRIDVLVNNAGYGSYGALEDVPLDEARRQFDVNVFGLARLTQLVLPTMRAQRSGKVINMSSMGGKMYEPLGSWYHATKFAVEGLSDSLRLELKPFGIHVVIIEPGAIITEWNAIARDSLLEVSGDTAYGPLAQSVAAEMAAADAPGEGSPPTVVADAVAAAVKARHPKTRYPIGRHARAVVLGRRLLPDVAMDAVLWRRYTRHM